MVIFQVPKIGEYYRNDLGAEFSQGRMNNFIFSAYCLSLFSTNNQYSVVTVLNEFDRPTKKRVNMVRLGDAAGLLGGSPQCPKAGLGVEGFT